MVNYKIQNLAYLLIIIILTGYLLNIGSSIIIPIIFAGLLSVFLNPLENKIRSVVKMKWLAILLSFLAIIFPIVLITTIFSIQLLNIMEALPSISESFGKGLDKLLLKINNLVPYLKLRPADLAPSSETNIEGPMKILGQGLISTTNILASSGLVIIYSLLFLYYKTSIQNFIIFAFDKENRPDIKETISKIKNIIQSYIGGLGLVILILTVLNTIGLTLIGIEYALFWGALAGMLAVIPFIGTLIGGLLPFIFALSSAEANWQPYAVIIYYLLIQQIEGNFITPKIVGNKVDINPLFAILAIVIFGSFWGIAGVILALPLISILKIILSQFEQTKPIALLMSSDISTKKGIFKKLAQQK